MILFRKDFNCKRCGSCCKELSGTFSLTKEEVDEWQGMVFKSKFGVFPAIKFISSNIFMPGISGPFLHPETSEVLSECPFLTKKEDLHVCMIYERRPKACRNFPFDGKFIDITKTLCPEVMSVRKSLKKNKKTLEKIIQDKNK